MKKISVILLVAMAMVSCGNTYKAKTVALVNQNDSVNYALGYLNGAQIKMYQMRECSDAEANEFLAAIERGYNGKVEELEEVEQIGKNIGQAIKASEKNGLADNKAWAVNEKILFQAMINTIKGDTTMTVDFAREFFQTSYQASRMQEMPEKAAKAVRAKCGTTAKAIELKTLNDSLNYAFGVLNGFEIKNYALNNDSTGEDLTTLVKFINKGLKTNVLNPQAVGMGENIGKTIKDQEATGLIGIEQLTTDFALLHQGFVNGLLGDTTMMKMEEAGQYIETTVNNIKFGDTKTQGEQFLQENAQREGVTVTESGLQYEVIKMGKGPKPAADSRVKVHYHGTLIDGTVFDSSVDRGEPITFGLNQVIKGWTEGVQLMPVGSKFRFFIPQELGYGAQNAGSIPPYSTLIFEVELLGIEK